MKNSIRSLRKNDAAAVEIGDVTKVAFTVVGLILGAIVSLIILAALFPSYSGAVGNLSENLSTSDWGDATANSIAPVFGLLVSLGGLFAVAGLAFAAYQLTKRD
jgi:hypothetical protein